jgi:hypothetical protein
VRTQLLALLAAFRGWSGDFERVVQAAIAAEEDDMAERDPAERDAWHEIDLAADPDVAALLARLPRPSPELVRHAAEMRRMIAPLLPPPETRRVLAEIAANIAKMTADMPRLTPLPEFRRLAASGGIFRRRMEGGGR